MVAKIKYKLNNIYFVFLKMFIFRFNFKIVGDPRKIKIGNNTHIDSTVIFYVSKGFIKIGSDCLIKSNVILSTEGGQIIIGNKCSINPFTILYGDAGLTIDDNVMIAANTTIVPANHVFDSIEIPMNRQGMRGEGINIKSDVWIGAGVTILDGVLINTGAIIGAGAVVNSEIPSFAICAGVPARIKKFRN